MAISQTVELYVLPTGYLWLPDRWIFADGDRGVRHLSPDFSFLIRHPSGKNVLFDLGMRKVSCILKGLEPALERARVLTKTRRIWRGILESSERTIP